MENHSSIKENRKKYTIAITITVLLNIGLAVFLLQHTFAQKFESKYLNQTPLLAKVLPQNDSPINITIINVDNSPISNQTINFSLQNISKLPIIAYTIIVSNQDAKGKIITDFLPVKSFEVNSAHQDQLDIERENIKPSGTISFSIDYVEFEDGSSWGEDTQGQSEHIYGGHTGVESAIKELRELASKSQTNKLHTLLEKDLADINPALPNETQNEKWKKGFIDGYKGIISFVKNQRTKGNTDILEKLNEIENKNRAVRRIK